MAEPTPVPQTVVIQLPGVRDIIAMPVNEPENAKRERLSRWALQAAASPIPESLRWLPQVVNWFDDIQDFVFVVTSSVVWSLSLVLRKFPTRFIPYLGWALLANDALNICTAIAGAPLVPRLNKVEFLKFTKRAVAGKGAYIRAAEAFALPGRAKLLPFALQAGQVLYSWTGWGLKLGSVMGALSDTFWAAIKAAQGADVVIKPPPKSDILGYAAWCLSRSIYWEALMHVANSDELKWVLNGLAVAAGVMAAPTIPADLGSRLEEFDDLQFPLFPTLNAFTADELRRMVFPSVFDQKIALAVGARTIPWSDAVRISIASQPLTDIELAVRFRPTTYDWPFGLQASELAQWTWDVFGGGHDFVVPSSSPMERMLGIALEQGLVPPFMYHPRDTRTIEQLRKWGIEIRDVPDCLAPTGPLFVHPPYEKLPPAYPPPSEDPNVQIAHWCAIGLALWCGRAILLPAIAPKFERVDEYSCNTEIVGWGVNKRRWGLASMDMASWLVWGVAYYRFAKSDSEPPKRKVDKPRLCYDSGFALPSVSGYRPELPGLNEVLAAFPGDAVTLQRTGETGMPFDPMLGRDWLDAYMKTLDPRRVGEAAFPSIEELPLPETYIVPERGF